MNRRFMDPVADLMTMLRTAEAMTLDDLSRSLGLSERSVAFMLAEHCRRGQLVKRADGAYALGPGRPSRRRGLAADQLVELLATVAYCEGMWRLQDRLDADFAASQRRQAGGPRS